MTVNKPVYCRNCGTALTWQEQMGPAWTRGVCDWCAFLEVNDIRRSEPRGEDRTDRYAEGDRRYHEAVDAKLQEESHG